MENEQRIVELLTETLIKFDSLIEGQKTLVEGQKVTNDRLDRVEREVVKLNLLTSENTRALIKLIGEVEKIADLHERVTELEHTVYK
jgi:uncharacterized protein Yka (UPF0111/DUF47 family)